MPIMLPKNIHCNLGSETIQVLFRLTTGKWDSAPHLRKVTMPKITSYLLAALLSLGIIGSSLQTADAGKRHRRIAAGVAIGLLGVAIVADQYDRKRRRRHIRRRYYDDDYTPRYRRVQRRWHKRYYRHTHKNYRRHYKKQRRYRKHYRHTYEKHYCGFQIINGRRHEFCT